MKKLSKVILTTGSAIILSLAFSSCTTAVSEKATAENQSSGEPAVVNTPDAPEEKTAIYRLRAENGYVLEVFNDATCRIKLKYLSINGTFSVDGEFFLFKFKTGEKLAFNINKATENSVFIYGLVGGEPFNDVEFFIEKIS